jgi:GTP cyclohydrolase I
MNYPTYEPDSKDDPRIQAMAHAEQLLRRLPMWDSVDEHHRAETPLRFVDMLIEMCTPTDFDKRFKVFPNHGMDEMIVLAPIPFYTLCAHHVVPFYGNAYIGYVPDESIAGLSKFARVVKGMAKGLWVQEELTQAIADYLNERLRPAGVAVVLRAEHMCMAMRGIAQPGVITTTSSMKGVFGDHSRTAKAEFFAWLQGAK